MDRKMRDRMANLPPSQSIKRKEDGEKEKVRPVLTGKETSLSIPSIRTPWPRLVLHDPFLYFIITSCTSWPRLVFMTHSCTSWSLLVLHDPVLYFMTCLVLHDLSCNSWTLLYVLPRLLRMTAWHLLVRMTPSASCIPKPVLTLQDPFLYSLTPSCTSWPLFVLHDTFLYFMTPSCTSWPLLVLHDLFWYFMAPSCTSGPFLVLHNPFLNFLTLSCTS